MVSTDPPLRIAYSVNVSAAGSRLKHAIAAKVTLSCSERNSPVLVENRLPAGQER